MVDALERREALGTREALTATTNRRAFLGDTGVDDLGVVGTTDWAEHLEEDTAAAVVGPRQDGPTTAREL